MSIIPFGDPNNATNPNPDSSSLWDHPEAFFNDLSLWDPFQDFPPFPALLSSHFPSVFPSRGTQVSYKETPRAHVFRASFPMSTAEEVLVHIDDENTLQISTGDGKFVSRFKLPEDARRDGVNAAMVHGVLTVTVPKEGATNNLRSNVREIEISGSG